MPEIKQKELRLNDEDKAKLGLEKRIAYIISFLVFSGFSFAAFIIVLTTGSVDDKFNWSLFILLIFINFLISFLIEHLINRKYKKDIAGDIKISKNEIVQFKEKQIDWEAGSGNHSSPILADFFPKIFARDMKEVNRLNLIINKHRHRVDKDLFNSVEKGEEVRMFKAKYSDVVLGIEKIK